MYLDRNRYINFTVKEIKLILEIWIKARFPYWNLSSAFIGFFQISRFALKCFGSSCVSTKIILPGFESTSCKIYPSRILIAELAGIIL